MAGDTLQQRIGRFLKQRRTWLDMTQADAARLCDCGQADIAHMEQGRHCPSVERLAEVLTRMGYEPVLTASRGQRRWRLPLSQ